MRALGGRAGRARRGLSWAAAAVLCGGATVAVAADGCGGSAFELVSADASTATDSAARADAPVVDAGFDASSEGASASPDASDANTPPPKDGATSPDANGADGDVVDASDASAAAFRCTNFTGADVVFCSDFDEGTSPPWNWAYDLVGGKATISADTTDFLSPPNGFAAEVPAFLTGNATLDSLVTSFMSSKTHLAYSFEMFVKTYDGVAGSTMTSPTIPVAQMQIGLGGTTALFLDIAFNGSELLLVQGYPAADGGTQSSSTPVSGTVGMQTWAKVDLVVDRSTMPWTVTVSVDGVAGLSAPAAYTVNDPNVQLQLGIVEVVPPAAANAFTFDNVLVRAY